MSGASTIYAIIPTQSPRRRICGLLMANDGIKRRYGKSLEFVRAGFLACLQNAKDLVAASKVLIDSGYLAPALSLSVLALEEIGKLIAIDGLLFARADSDRAGKAMKADRSHIVKLQALAVVDMMVAKTSLVDPRNCVEGPYATALAVILQQLEAAKHAVLDLLPGRDFQLLNRMKQEGFYVGTDQEKFICPRDVVDPALSKAVYNFAWAAAGAMATVLSGDNLERYFDMAASIQSRSTEQSHQHDEFIGRQLTELMFDSEENRSDKPSESSIKH
jgi:AbiV family abortive infection protein